VQVLSDSIVRVRATKAGEFGPDFSYAIAKKNWQKTRVTNTGGKIKTKKLTVTISRSPLRITFATPDGTVLNRELGIEGRDEMPGAVSAQRREFFGCVKTGQFNKRGQSFGFWATTTRSTLISTARVCLNSISNQTRGWNLLGQHADVLQPRSATRLNFLGAMRRD
jgi:hypothetical protein